MSHVTTKQIRLLLVDDHEVVRMGLRAVLTRADTIAVVGEADSMASGVAEAVRLQPTVVLLDLRLPDGTGVDACRAILEQCPDTHVLFLTSFADEDAVLSTTLAGASGYLLKTIGGQALIQAIQAVAAGQSILDPAVTKTVLSRVRSSPPTARDSLSPQERRVLMQVAEGKTNKEIGAVLGLSDKTVKTYLYNIFQKLQVTRRTEAAAKFIKHQSN